VRVLRLLAPVAVVLATVPAASAKPAPPGFRVIFPRQVIQIAAAPQRSGRQRSCSTGASRSRSRLHVVACEQPPRSKVNTADGYVFGSFHP
jgi:hypothetical protein